MPDHVVLVGQADSLVFLTGGKADGLGWAALFANGAKEASAYIRLVPDKPDDERPHYEVGELYLVASGNPITGRDLRAIPLGRVEASVNQVANRERMKRLARTRGGQLGLTFDFDLDAMVARQPRSSRRPRMTLKVPEGHRKPDSFYEQVAYRYGWLQGEGLRPAAELAEANGVPVTTVHRWIKEARRRGIMAPGQRSTRTEQA